MPESCISVLQMLSKNQSNYRKYSVEKGERRLLILCKLYSFQSLGNYSNIPTIKSFFQVCFYKNAENLDIW